MEELQARVASLSSHRDSNWEVLHQRLRELEQQDFDSAAITDLATSTSQEISRLREENRVMLRCAKELKVIIEESLDLF
ncbi:hypothetical protein AMTR_s00081p00178150 [Amborella trichopoda]|uniref:Uncharacterized protein n=1 Tax=Amborella trichopoda TaxID=13333 RepID=W1P9E7_AMBTC|nr:hypothetical protein AMTR_s00081p00178150 [Amborella trichopoda]